MAEQTEYPEGKAEKVWAYGDATCSIVKVGWSGHAHYCGYVRFPARPVRETGYQGFMNYVPAHGGLTYAEQSADGSMVYGFDCAHSGDEDDPNLRDIDWLTKHCEQIADWILAAPPFEERYLLAMTNEEKAKVIDGYTEAIGRDGVDQNFGVMLNLLSGQL